jgi:hypothetical protein
MLQELFTGVSVLDLSTLELLFNSDGNVIVSDIFFVLSLYSLFNSYVFVDDLDGDVIPSRHLLVCVF